MPRIIVAYVHAVDAMNYRIGRITMYLIFAMMGVLLYSSISKTFFNPSLFTIEIAQFLMVTYFLVGGPYAMQTGDHVRMDLAYGSWSVKTRAWVDAFTSIFLFAYLGILLYGAMNSTAYSLGYFGTSGPEYFRDLAWAFVTGGPEKAGKLIGFLDRAPTAWRPFMWPVKSVMTIGIFLMLLQSTSMFFKDIATIRGEKL
jgi:TRAP-type mannitol/chloroaromatic compound transport system permease small subunit